MKKRKKEGSQFVAVLILILFMVGGVVFLSLLEPSPSLTGMAKGGVPGAPGGDAGTTTTTVIEGGGGGPSPVKVIVKSPLDGDTIKRGVLTILVEGYIANNLNSDIRISAESELFETVKLVSNFEQRGSGIYGANVTISKDIKKGEYAIVVKGERATHDEERILITVDPTIYINTFLNKKEFFKGERIRLSGDLKYFNQEPVENNTIEISISAPDFLLNKTIVSNMFSIFEDDYLISFAEPDGKWNIKIQTVDEDDNEGSALVPITVSTPEGVAFYTVTFLSPLTNAEFKRGSSVPITVEIKEEGKPLTDAVVDFRNPRAEITSLQEVASGTYTTEYKIKPDDPLGKWYITVQAVKTVNGITRAGGTKIPVTILPAALNLVLVSPRTADFFAGLQTEIKAELSYADGTEVEKADVFATIGNQTIKLSAGDLGVYSAFYLFTEKDITATSLQLEAYDIYGNSAALTPKAIEVEQIGKYELKLRLFYYNILVRYWYLFVLGVILVILITEPLWHRVYLKRSLKRAIENEKRVIEMEKDIQRKYFKHHSLTREDYDKLMLKYRERASDLKEKRLKLNEKLAGKKRKEKS